MVIKKAKIIVGIAILFFVVMPSAGQALQMPGFSTVASFLPGVSDGISAQSYIVLNADTDQVLAQKNQDALWVPASLTKLVTAMVFLDTKPNLKKVVAITQADQTAGGCSVGGACIYTKAGISYKLDDLLHASLIASANNATYALARSTGLTMDKFVDRMNEKAKELGASGTHFKEPTGMDPANTTTASDYSKIIKAALLVPAIQQIDVLPSYAFRAYNSTKYTHNLKNTNKLLEDDLFTMVGAKTGFLDESKYNFATQLKDRFGNNLIVVLMGSENSYTEFADARQLASLGGLMLAFSGFNWNSNVLGTSTVATGK